MPGIDKIDLRSITDATSFSFIESHTGKGGSAVINFGSGDTLTLTKVKLSQLDSDDFIFHPEAPTLVGQKFLINSGLDGQQGQSALAPLADGRFVAVWSSNGNINGRIFDANGVPSFANESSLDFKVSNVVSSDQRAPNVVGLSDGGFVVTWSTGDFEQGFDARARKFNADGRPIEINGSNSELIINAQIRGYGAPVADLHGGRFVVTWTTSANPSDVNAQFFDAQSRPEGNKFVVAGVSTLDEFDPGVVCLSDGRLLVTRTTFDEELYIGDLRGTIYNADGSRTNYNDFLISNPADADFARLAHVVALSSGGFAAVWNSSFDQEGSDVIRVRAFDKSAEPLGDSFLVNGPLSSFGSYADITALDGGRFLVVWNGVLYRENYADDVIAGRVFDLDGLPESENAFVISDLVDNEYLNNELSVVSLAGGRIAVAWSYQHTFTQEYDIHAQLLDV